MPSLHSHFVSEISCLIASSDATTSFLVFRRSPLKILHAVFSGRPASPKAPGAWSASVSGPQTFLWRCASCLVGFVQQPPFGGHSPRTSPPDRLPEVWALGTGPDPVRIASRATLPSCARTVGKACEVQTGRSVPSSVSSLRPAGRRSAATARSTENRPHPIDWVQPNPYSRTRQFGL